MKEILTILIQENILDCDSEAEKWTKVKSEKHKIQSRFLSIFEHNAALGRMLHASFEGSHDIFR